MAAPNSIEGTLTLIDNQIDQATGTVKLKATFGNAHNTLWPGQYVNARVLVRTDRNCADHARRRPCSSAPTDRSPMSSKPTRPSRCGR